MKKRSSQGSESRSSQATKKILAVFGTRPEAIKLCPLIRRLWESEGVEVRACVSSQHRELLHDALETFGVIPEYDLDIMTDSQTLFDVNIGVMRGLCGILRSYAPELLLVHGDTTTALAAAMSGFYMNIPTAHIEAGLRTGNIVSPFPEEFNRRVIALCAELHFAPTERARENLLAEGIDGRNIFVTGNTVMDALGYTLREDYHHVLLEELLGKRIIFLTAHRRENAERLEGMLLAVRDILEEYGDVGVIYPVHPNPRIGRIAHDILGNTRGAILCAPLSVSECHNILARSYIALTDSGGLQEEAAALGIPTLVMRKETERAEGIESGIAALVGTDRESVSLGVRRVLCDESVREGMSRSKNPYGGGGVCEEIARILLCRLRS